MTWHAPADDAMADVLLARVPGDIVQTLTEEQRRAVIQAMRDVSRSHLVDIRLTFPFFKRRYYLTILSGEEKRNPTRRRIDSELRPMRTMGNMLFVLGIAALFYIVAIIGIFFYSEVVEL